MTAPEDIIALGQALHGEPWLDKMAADMVYGVSQLWRVVYKGAPVTRRMQRELEKRRAEVSWLTV